MLYIWNLHNIVNQLYLNKKERSKQTSKRINKLGQMFRESAKGRSQSIGYNERQINW